MTEAHVDAENKIDEKNLTEEEKEKKRKKELADEFLKTVESKLRKEEHRIWMVKDPDHLDRFKD